MNNEQGIAINRTHFINGPLMEAHFGDAAGQAYLLSVAKQSTLRGVETQECLAKYASVVSY